VKNSEIIHDVSGRRASFGSLAEKASGMKPPQDVKLKEPKDFKLVGKPTKRLNTREKINGAAIFGLDVPVPGMRVAMVARPPSSGGKVKSFDAAKAMPGVKHVVQIDRGVAVVADGFWSAKHGRATLTVDWDEGPLATLDSTTQGKEYADLASRPGAVAKKEGDVAPVLAGATKKFDAIYELAYLSPRLHGADQLRRRRAA
jgi:isoquinoline 1-oxidoreductase beta subunit